MGIPGGNAEGGYSPPCRPAEVSDIRRRRETLRGLGRDRRGGGLRRRTGEQDEERQGRDLDRLGDEAEELHGLRHLLAGLRHQLADRVRRDDDRKSTRLNST